MSALEGPVRVAIIGLGVMGGSLARSLRASPKPPRILAATLDTRDAEAALSAGAVDQVIDADDAISQADCIVYAVPVAATVTLIGRHAGRAPTDALIMDLASVKGPVVRAAEAAGIADRFVGAHPMCGSEQSGFAGARADMYLGARIWLVPASGAAPVQRAETFWRSLGGRPVRTEAAAHDRAVAWSSHLPQLVSSSLATALREADLSGADLGPGAMDMTRIARSSADLWADILEANADNLDAPLSAMISLLETARTAARAHDRSALEAMIARGHALHGEPT